MMVDGLKSAEAPEREHIKRYTSTVVDGSRSTGVTQGEHIASLGDLLGIIWKRLWIIILVAVALTGAAAWFTLLQTPMYQASVMILIGQERGITDTPGDVVGLQQVTQTMAEAVSSRPVSDTVIQQLDLQTTPGDFENNLSAEQVATTQFIEVNYRDDDPERAQQVANTVGDVFSEQVSEVSSSANAVTATVWERAATPESSVSPNLLLNIALALVFGTLLGAGLAFLLEYLDDSWRSEEVEQVSGVPTFGVIPRFEVSKASTPRDKKRRGGY